MIRGTKRPVEVTKVKKELSCSLHNRFDIEVIDAKTSEIKTKAQAENIILNSLWNHMFYPRTWFNAIHFGTGSGTPAITDTSLFAFLGAITAGTITYTHNFEEKWVSARRSIQLNETQYVGSTFTEVGIGQSTTASTLCTHAMLTDMNGNPISIEKTSTDIINIYATVFAHWHNIDGTNNIFLEEREETVPILYMLGLASSMGSIRPVYITAAEYHISDDNYLYVGPSSSYMNSIYAVATKTVTHTAPRLAAGVGNLLYGIRKITLCMQNNSYWWLPDLVLDVGGSWFPKTTIVGEAIGTGDGTTNDFKTDFGFVLPGTKIYVNGVEQVSGVTIDTNMPINNANIGAYFERIPEYSYISSHSSPLLSFGMSGNSEYSNGNEVYYNPYYAKGVKYCESYRTMLEASNDLETWVPMPATISGNSRYYTIPVEYQNYKYWKIYYLGEYIHGMSAMECLSDLNNIHFTTPPAAGAVITADYETETIAKDANHVFDFSLVLTFSEYTD